MTTSTACDLLSCAEWGASGVRRPNRRRLGHSDVASVLASATKGFLPCVLGAASRIRCCCRACTANSRAVVPVYQRDHLARCVSCRCWLWQASALSGCLIVWLSDCLVAATAEPDVMMQKPNGGFASRYFASLMFMFGPLYVSVMRAAASAVVTHRNTYLNRTGLRADPTVSLQRADHELTWQISKGLLGALGCGLLRPSRALYHCVGVSLSRFAVAHGTVLAQIGVRVGECVGTVATVLTAATGWHISLGQAGFEVHDHRISTHRAVLVSLCCVVSYWPCCALE